MGSHEWGWLGGICWKWLGPCWRLVDQEVAWLYLPKKAEEKHEEQEEERRVKDKAQEESGRG